MARTRVALFVTCLVDLFRPSVGFAAVKLLEDAGCEVVVPTNQTCCGQPAYNQGARAETAELARQSIKTFAGFDYVIVPSGSCAGMLRKHYSTLFSPEDPIFAEAENLASRIFELVSFLTDILDVKRVDGQLHATATYHDSCSGLRELNIKEQPRKLLASLDGLRLIEMESAEVCCGFGGTFCVKYPDISTKMVTDKAHHIDETDADLLLAGDLGCLFNMAGRLKRQGSRIDVRHVAEVLAGNLDAPPIGDVSHDGTSKHRD